MLVLNIKYGEIITVLFLVWASGFMNSTYSPDLTEPQEKVKISSKLNLQSSTELKQSKQKIISHHQQAQSVSVKLHI